MKNILLILLFMLSLEAKERVVSLSPSITEILYALGADEEIVATSSYSLYPPEALKLPIIGSYTNPHIEKILSQKPTLVIGQNFNQNTLEKLQYFHIQTLQLELTTIKSIQDSINKIAKRLSKEDRAEILVTNIENKIQKFKKVKNPHSVMIVYGLKEDLRSGIYIAGKEIFFDDIIRLSGNKNAYTDKNTAQPVLNYENVIALNPEQIIILHSHATEPNVDIQKALKAWYSLPTRASKNRQITIIDEDYLHIPSQRVALTIERLMKVMND
ncbi:ABC transporter substrate-binding protein [Sulfurimonas sp. SAG-AH-194-L11]|nr:helical backbone metal receptor [Sulfurimonas sp. SAG-AH-194-L11]MDF1878002.1 ABC transporter substrate-binding protein [Sulfurimonas sp. SAG-AH-194-L11]